MAAAQQESDSGLRGAFGELREEVVGARQDQFSLRAEMEDALRETGDECAELQGARRAAEVRLKSAEAGVDQLGIAAAVEAALLEAALCGVDARGAQREEVQRAELATLATTTRSAVLAVQAHVDQLEGELGEGAPL